MRFVGLDPGGDIASCLEIPGAKCQGKTRAAALKSLVDAIALILEDRRKDGLRGGPASGEREKVEDKPWGTRDVMTTTPDGHRIAFCQSSSSRGISPL